MSWLHPSDLLGLDPQRLLEERSVAEVQEVRKRLRSEVERKKEELRVTVGERYRDLIEAADTISDMRDQANSLIVHLGQVEGKLLGAGGLGSAASEGARRADKGRYYSVAVRIRLLLDIPERIWAAVERLDYLQASQLYLLARHVHTGLTLESWGELPLTRIFPVLGRQWSQLEHFGDAVLQGCRVQMQVGHAEEDSVTGCMSAVALLKGASPDDVFRDVFLPSRTEAVRHVLKSDAGIRMQASEMAAVIAHTVHLTRVFQTGAISNLLKLVSGADSSPVLSLLGALESWRPQHLPNVVLEYRPSLPPDALIDSAHLKQWLSNLKSELDAELPQLLRYVDTARGLSAVRDTVWEALSESDNEVNVWDEFFRSSVTQRVLEIVKASVRLIDDSMRSAIVKSMREAQRETTQPEHDLQWFVWSESDSDLPESPGWMSSRKSAGLMMKTKGYSPRVQSLCTTLDTKLKVLLDDMSAYTESDSSPFDLTITEHAPPFDKYADAAQVRSQVRACVTEAMSSLLQFVQSESGELKSSDPAKLLLLSRFLLATCELCLHLQTCASLDAKTDLPEWTRLKSEFRDCSSVMYEKWKSGVVESGHARLVQGLSTTLEATLTMMAEWEVVQIQEEGEEGSVKSSIRIPAHISLSLTSALFYTVREVNKVIPHALPRKIQASLTMELLDRLLSHYETLEVQMQAQALQLLFDVRYLDQLFYVRNGSQRIQTLCERFEAKVDPFDLDVFSPYLQQNLKKCIQRTQLVVGILIPPEKLALLAATRPQSGSAPDKPNILAVSTGVPWFPLLPLATLPSGREVKSKRMDEPKVTLDLSSGKTKEDASPMPTTRSSAAAFFEASLSWFGS